MKDMSLRACSNFLPVQVKIGRMGRHYIALILDDPDIATTRMKFAVAEEFIYVSAITFSKLVILSLYLRIFTTRTLKHLAFATGATIILTCVVSFIISASICRPFSYHWDKTIPNGKCGNTMAAYRLIRIPNIASDLVLLVLPLHSIAQLHLKLPAKIGLVITFLTGSIYVKPSPKKTTTKS